MQMRGPQPRITDPSNHPTRDVCLRVAAEFLGMDHRTLKSRIKKGHITAYNDGRVYRVSVSRLAAYKQYHTDEGTDAI